MSGQGTLVYAADYNAIQAIAAKVLGAPTDALPQFGYNQGLLSTQVSNGTPANKISVNQWSNLQRDLIYARIHQNGNAANEASLLAIPNDTNVVSESFRSSYANYAQTVLTNAAVAAPSQVSTTNIATAIGTAARINAWNGNIYSGVTLDFGNLAAARSFWNAGGNISIAVSLSGNFNTKSVAKDNTWAGMFGAMGTITINRNTTTITGSSTGGYTCTPVAKGYFDLTTSSQQLFTCIPPSSGSYAANSFKVFAYIDGSGRYLYLTIQYNDDSTVTSGASATWGGDEYVDGILTQYIGCTRASGSYVSSNPPGVVFTGDLTNMSGAPALYGLSADKYVVNEGESFTVTLQTQNVNNGAIKYYTVSGMNNTPNNVSRWSCTSSYFTVNNNTASLVFTINNDLYSDGTSTMTISVDGLTSINVTINDTSNTPKNVVNYTTFTNFTVPDGIFRIGVAMVGGGGGGGNYAGGGGGGGQVVTTTLDVAPRQGLTFNPGQGGAAGANGGTSTFGGLTALGGYAGSAGSGYAGAKGGQSGQGYSGGNGVTTPTPYLQGGGASNNAVYRLAGGGGGGQGGTGADATQDANNAVGGVGGTGSIISTLWANYGVNTAYWWGGGGEGGSSGIEGTANSSYGGGAGGGHDQAGFNGTGGTGGGGGGGGVTIGGGTYTGTYVSGTITGKSGGLGGNGGIVIYWPI
jgi:hypothetical protein